MMEKRGEGNYPIGNGNLSSLAVQGDSIAEAWEKSVVELYNKGLWYHHGGRKDQGKLQVASTMMITINKPDSDYLIHKFGRSDWKNLVGYQMEMLGAVNSWVDPSGKTTQWPYHYHERLTQYPGTRGPINQLEEILNKMVSKIATRSLNAITWVPERDNRSEDPPCLQRIWFEVIPDESSETEKYVLNMNYNFRSRNVMIAAPMNQLGLNTLFTDMTDKARDITQKDIVKGRIVDFNDNYHVSSSNLPILDTFMTQLEDCIQRNEPAEEYRWLANEYVIPTFFEPTMSIAEAAIIEETSKHLSDQALEKEIEKIKQISKRVSEINLRLLK